MTKGVWGAPQEIPELVGVCRHHLPNSLIRSLINVRQRIFGMEVEMKFVETATRVARGLTVAFAILVPASMIAASGPAYAQWGGGWGGVDWQWAPASSPGIPGTVPPYGYPYYAVPGYFQAVHAYDPTVGVPGNAYSGYGNAYASGYGARLWRWIRPWLR